MQLTGSVALRGTAHEAQDLSTVKLFNITMQSEFETDSKFDLSGTFLSPETGSMLKEGVRRPTSPQQARFFYLSRLQPAPDGVF